MLSKLQRFQQWRGQEADSEEHYFQAASLMSQYIDSVDSLDTIRDHFKGGTDSALLNRFGSLEERTKGALLFAKFVIDEVLEQIQCGSSKQQTLYNSLNELSNIIASIYENSRKPSTENINKALIILNNVLGLDDAAFTDKEKEPLVKLLLTLFFLLNLVEPTLSSLSRWFFFVVSCFIPIEQIRKNVGDLMQKVEEKKYMISPVIESSDASDFIKLAQACFNRRYLNLLAVSPLKESIQDISLDEEKRVKELEIINKLTLLQGNMKQTANALVRLVNLRRSHQELTLQFNSLGKLSLAVEEKNQQGSSGSRCFLDLIDNNAAEYRVFLSMLSEHEKKIFQFNVEQLEINRQEKNRLQQVVQKLHWLAGAVGHIASSSSLQNITSRSLILKITLDGECKRLLKSCLTRYVIELTARLKKQEREMGCIRKQLFQDDEELMHQVLIEPDKALLELQKITQEACGAIYNYRVVLNSVKENMDFLHKYQMDSQVLEAFIRVNNTFWVRLSNFFAQICWLFKTDAARMVDGVIQCKAKVDAFKVEYQKTIECTLEQINRDVHVDKRIKNELKKQFNTEISRKHAATADDRAADERSIRLLINSLSKLWNTNARPVIESMSLGIPDHDELFVDEDSFPPIFSDVSPVMSG